jgi:hypothetical protein
MNLLIHDLNNFNQTFSLKSDPNNTVIISDNGKIHPCICCFGCWIKTPGQCVIKDGYDNMGLLHAQCNHLIIISQCFYGSYSSFDADEAAPWTGDVLRLAGIHGAREYTC